MGSLALIHNILGHAAVGTLAAGIAQYFAKEDKTEAPKGEDKTEAPKGGCSSVVGFSAVAIMAAAAASVSLKEKKQLSLSITSISTTLISNFLHRTFTPTASMLSVFFFAKPY